MQNLFVYRLHVVCILGLSFDFVKSSYNNVCSKTSLANAMHKSSMIIHSNTNLGCIKNVESFKELVVSVRGLALVAIPLFAVLQLLYIMNLIKYV